MYFFLVLILAFVGLDCALNCKHICAKEGNCEK
jgi:hypothetical protein